MLSLTQPAVECHAFQPSRHIGLGDASAYHPLEVYNEVECYFVSVVGVDKYHISAPFIFFLKAVHNCKDSAIRLNGKINATLIIIKWTKLVYIWKRKDGGYTVDCIY